MDILLASTYFMVEDSQEQRVMKPFPPLGILYISSHLKEKGFDVGVYDATFSSFGDFAAVVREKRPPVVGLYATLMTRQSTLRSIQLCRSLGSLVVLGGPEPAEHAAEYLSRGANVVVRGEGEITLEELIPALMEGSDLREIKGITFCGEDGKLCENSGRELIPDLDSQPLPDRASIDQQRYLEVWRRHHGYGPVSLITARGCPYTCTWCSHSVFGHTHRRRSPQMVVDEIEGIVSSYKPDRLWYADDVFTINHRWLNRFAESLEDRKIRLPFETITREDRLNEEVIELLGEMGCHRIWIGTESGSQRILDAMKRRTDAARAQEMTHLLKDRGIQVGMFIMVGYEGETEEDIKATIEHLKSAEPDVFLTTLAYPIKGTPYYESVAGNIAPNSWERTTDRDLTVTDRHSRRYYQHAMRWIEGEVAAYRESRLASPSYLRLVKAYYNAVAGRLGMMMRRREVEPQQRKGSH